MALNDKLRLSASVGPGSTSWQNGIIIDPYLCLIPTRDRLALRIKKKILAPSHSTVESWEVPTFVLGSTPTSQAPLEELLPTPFILSPWGQPSNQSTFHCDHRVSVMRGSSSENFRVLLTPQLALLRVPPPLCSPSTPPSFPPSLYPSLLPSLPPTFLSHFLLCPWLLSFLLQTSSSPSSKTIVITSGVTGVPHAQLEPSVSLWTQ